MDCSKNQWIDTLRIGRWPLEVEKRAARHFDAYLGR